ncbi:MAG TPA: Rne/Rng family ribonuclease [Epulopiscium sp.]|nr:Rne/Rng family ribonuclease [Candidatus Epulonipiscium sp.]
METSIIIDVGISYTRAAICEDDELVNILLENNYEKQIQGTIYQGKVSNVVKGIKAAFIEIGGPKKAFLHYKDIPEELKGKLQNNQRMMVQVVKEGVGDKGPKVTAFINISGKYLILLPFEKTVGISKKIEDEQERKRLKNIIIKHNPHNYGVIVRTGAVKATSERLSLELEELIARWEDVETRSIGAAGETVLYEEPSLPMKVIREYANQGIKEIVINHQDEGEKVISFLSKHLKEIQDKVRIVDDTTNLYGAYTIDKEIEKALKKRIWLKSGANIIIEQTEAMNVIDVNSAKLITIKQKDKTILKANLQAAKESARQIRIRNLSGIIIIDFIDMESEDHKNQVIQELQLEFNKDKIKTRVYPITELGIVQITRQRKHLSLKDQIMQHCHCCNTAHMEITYDYLLVHIEKDIRDIARESIHKDIEMRATLELIKHIERNSNFIEKIQSRYGVNLYLTEDKSINKTWYDIKPLLKES